MQPAQLPCRHTRADAPGIDETFDERFSLRHQNLSHCDEWSLRDYIHIPPVRRHRAEWTSPSEPTVGSPSIGSPMPEKRDRRFSEPRGYTHFKGHIARLE